MYFQCNLKFPRKNCWRLLTSAEQLQRALERMRKLRSTRMWAEDRAKSEISGLKIGQICYKIVKFRLQSMM